MKTLILILLISSVNSYATILGDLFGPKLVAGPCSLKIKPDELMYKSSFEENLDKARVLKENKRYCEAVIYFQYLEKQVSNPDLLVSIEVNIIESYFFQYDYERFFAKAEQFVQDRPSSNKEEYVRYLILKAVNELAERNQTSDSSNPWVQYGLGAHPEQFNETSVKNLMKYRLFIEKYPKSFWIEEVRSYFEKAKAFFNATYSNELRFMVMKREYAPAISRYKFLISQEPNTPDYTVYLYECIQTIFEFAYEVENEYHVRTHSLSRWLSLPEESITAEVRLKTKAALLAQGKNLLKHFLEKFPQDPWAIKARSEFN